MYVCDVFRSGGDGDVCASTVCCIPVAVQECASTGRRYTYAQLLDRVARWSGKLRELGVGRGDVVAVALPNCPEYPIVYFGTLALGATVTPVNITYTAGQSAALGYPPHTRMVKNNLKGRKSTFREQ